MPRPIKRWAMAPARSAFPSGPVSAWPHLPGLQASPAPVLTPRLSDVGRMYGYNPSPPKLEGIRRPVSRTVLLQSRRHSLPPQPTTEVSGAGPCRRSGLGGRSPATSGVFLCRAGSQLSTSARRVARGGDSGGAQLIFFRRGVALVVLCSRIRGLRVHPLPCETQSTRWDPRQP